MRKLTSVRSLRLLQFLLERSRRTVVLIGVAGVLSGLFSVAVVAIISHGLQSGAGAGGLLALAFVLLVAGKIAAGVVSQLLLVRFSQGTLLDLSITLVSRILGSPLRRIERHGAARLLATLTDDVGAVTWAVQCLPRLVMNAAVLLGCGLYLAWLSWRMFLVCFAVTAAGALTYKLLYDRAFDVIRTAREARTRLFGHFRTLTSGTKELQLHRARREAYIASELEPTAEEFRRANLAATTRYTLGDAWLQVLLYALIGLLLFVYPAIEAPSRETLTGYVFAILYMMTPLWTLIGIVPSIVQGQVALAKIDELGLSLDPPSAPAACEADPQPGRPVEIELRQVVFGYEDETGADHRFSLGPIDFRLRTGELVFVVGGNGSGKSTFVKVLTGLYTPRSGQIRINGVPVSSANVAGYREHFAVVFSDFHLFDSLLGLSAPRLEAAARHYLALLRLERKVELAGGRFSTTELSQGQRKRLALLTAYLEDRPVYVFDEWAADQDPEYKQVFYSRLLPDLRARGKAVVVVTHDDRYFHLGNRVVRLEDGRIVAATETAAPLTAHNTLRPLSAADAPG